MAPSRRERLVRELRELTSFRRDSAGKGEHQAAQIFSKRLKELGLNPRTEEVPAVGNYWLPLGGVNLLSVVAGVLLPRRVAVIVGLAGSALLASDVSAGKRHLRKPLRLRRAHNVIASIGEGDKTVVFHAHHDSAPSGQIFNPAIPRLAWKIAPHKMQANDSGPPVMAPVVAAPALVGVGSLMGWRRWKKAGVVLAAGVSAAMADVALRKTVPGANDNASGVVCLSELARYLTEKPLADTRVILLSTGSEESLLEGMEGFAKAHFPHLDPNTTMFVCLDSVGSDNLCVLAGEGMLRMHHYPRASVQMVKRIAEREGISLNSRLRHRNSTDALYPLRAGYPTVMIGSTDDMKLPANYHWKSDIEENINYESVGRAISLCEEIAREVDLWGVPA